MVFSLLVFFCNNFLQICFFQIWPNRVRPWMVVRVIRTYALFELSSDLVPFLRRVIMTHLWETSNVTIPWDLIGQHFFVILSLKFSEVTYVCNLCLRSDILCLSFSAVCRLTNDIKLVGLRGDHPLNTWWFPKKTRPPRTKTAPSDGPHVHMDNGRTFLSRPSISWTDSDDGPLKIS